MSLKYVLRCLERVDNRSKFNDKKKLLELYLEKDETGQLFKVIELVAMDKAFGFGEAQFSDYAFKLPSSVSKTFDLFDEFDGNPRSVSNDLKQRFAELSSIDEETVEVFNRISNKNLKCGLGADSLKEILYGKESPLKKYKDDLIMKWSDNKIDAFIKEAEEWDNVCWCIKKEGNRTRVIVDESGISYNVIGNRNAKNMDAYDADIIEFSKVALERGAKYPIIFDGILTYKHDNKIYVFDVVLEGLTLIDRTYLLKDGPGKLVEKLIHYDIDEDKFSIDGFLSIAQGMQDAGEEGIILKTKMGLCTRGISKSWCAIKPYKEVDVEVIQLDYLFDEVKGVTFIYKGKEMLVSNFSSNDLKGKFNKDYPRFVRIRYYGILPNGELRFPIIIS